MIAALPYMQFHIAEYLADTSHLSTEEHGAYLLLIFNYWQRGKALDNSNGRLANVVRMSNDRWSDVQVSLREFFTVEGDIWTHKRIERDLASVNAKCEQAKQAGKASGERRRNGRSTGVTTNVATTVPTERERNANDKKREEEKRKEERETPRVRGEQTPVCDASQLAKEVQVRTRLGGVFLYNTLTDVIEAELKAGSDGWGTVDRMEESLRRYGEAHEAGKLQTHSKPESFFGDGLWRDQKLWKWKKEHVPKAKTAPQQDPHIAKLLAYREGK